MADERGSPPSRLDPGEELARRDELSERLAWLINLRWIALAGVFVALLLARYFQILEKVWPLCGIASLMAVLNLGFSGLHRAYAGRTLRAVTAEALLQIAVDVIGLGMLVHYAGGLSNPFVLYFTFHVVIASILLDRRQAYVVAALTTLVVAFLALAEQIPGFEARPLHGAFEGPDGSSLERLGLVFVIGTTQIFSAYFVTTIVERLRGRNRDVRRLNADLADRVERLASAEKKLQAEHARARAILDCMDEGVVVVDLTGKVLLANTAGMQNVVVTLDDTFQRADVLLESAALAAVPASGEPAKNVSAATPADAHACLTETLTKGGMLSPEALALLGADPPKPARPVKLKPPPAPARVEIQRAGRRFENTVSGVHTDSGETLGLVVVSRDITERTQLERQVLHAEKLHAVGSLAAGVAHELNTPLGTILGYAQMLLEDPAAPQARKDLSAIESQARRCKGIVQGLLDFARKSGGGRETVRVSALMAKTAELTRHSLEMRGIALELDSAELARAPGGEPEVSVVPQEIEQVLVNLITNAADAIESLSETERKLRGGGCVRLLSAASGAGVRIAVEDNGPGVPEAIRGEIFEPFFTTKAAGKGTGLGLSIAHRILEDHGGTLELAARAAGQPGSRFELHLPAAGKAAGRLEAQATAAR
ncbi:MAG: hypothetical protein HY291_18490 [Planctomycetes bacterium]|nr:hypothetical protein [Planctomycetota bacterium]